MIEGQNYEITTYRLDQDYKDGRKPESVVFTPSLEKDLERRDFTINAMAYNPKKGLVDLFGGQVDLNSKILKTVGDPNKRFEEDYLRMLRAVRFANRFDLTLDEDVLDSIKERASKIEKISKERIQAELSSILLSDRPDRGIRLLYTSGLLPYIIIDMEKMVGFDQKTIHHQYDLFDHTLSVLSHTDKDLVIRLAALYHDIGKLWTMTIGQDGQGHFYGHDKVSAEIASKQLRDLRFDKKTIESVENLIAKHMNSANTYTIKSVKRLLRKLGETDTRRLFNLQIADIKSTNNPHFVENVENAKDYLDQILAEDDLIYENQVNINGRDLIEIGYKQGRDLGQALSIVKSLVLEGNLENDKQKILEYIKERSLKDEKNNYIRFLPGTKRQAER